MKVLLAFDDLVEDRYILLSFHLLILLSSRIHFSNALCSIFQTAFGVRVIIKTVNAKLYITYILMKYLLILALLALAFAAPEGDEVHIPIPYSHRYYSGTPLSTQASSILTLPPSTMSSSSPSVTPTTTL
jgi:hypothetical protein